VKLQNKEVVSDLKDWACAEDSGRQFVTRPFHRSMSLKTVTTLSAEWHDAVAANMTGPDVAFPAPWYSASKIGDYDIVPIEDSASLYREGAIMHHCVGTYADRVRSGELQIYSVRRSDARVATFSLKRCGLAASLDHIRGPCNARPPKEISAMVRRWLRSQKPSPGIALARIMDLLKDERSRGNSIVTVSGFLDLLKSKDGVATTGEYERLQPHVTQDTIDAYWAAQGGRETKHCSYITGDTEETPF
jgi:hypothetical protein